MPKSTADAKRPKKRKASRWQRYAKKYPEKAKRHNERRKKRRDNRDRQGIWGIRLRLLRLHCGEFFTRIQDKYYEGIEVRLTVIEIARMWFRDVAWTMYKPEIDRVDPEGHYEFTNCRFIEKKANLERRRTAGADFLGDQTPQDVQEPGSEG